MTATIPIEPWSIRTLGLTARGRERFSTPFGIRSCPCHLLNREVRIWKLTVFP